MSLLSSHIETILTGLISSPRQKGSNVAPAPPLLSTCGWRRSVSSLQSVCTVDGGDLSCVSAEVTGGLHQKIRSAGFETVKFSCRGEKEVEKGEVVVV